MRSRKIPGALLLLHNHDIKLAHQLIGHSLQSMSLRLCAYVVILLHISSVKRVQSAWGA